MREINVFQARKILAGNEIRPVKKRGQHFIVDRKIAELQVDYASLRATDLVFEIGAGLGALTETIASRGNKLIAIEIDKRLTHFLKTAIEPSSNISLVLADVLSFNLVGFDKLISSIPYNLSSQITFKILEMDFELAILTYQLDFAKRMVAIPGSRDYSRLSVNVYYRAEAEILDRISRDAFYPMPAVDSAIVKLKPRSPPFHVDDELLFFRVLRELFSHRNQFLRKVLRLFLRSNGLENIAALDMIGDAGIKDMRIRELEPESFARLSNVLHRLVTARAAPAE